MSKIKKVFITGGSGGIGSSICNKFYENKYTLILVSSSQEKLDIMKDKYGINNFYYKIDISNRESIEKEIIEINKNHKDISVIVNNAGVTDDGLAIRMSYDSWQKVLQTNLDSNFILLKALLPNMISNKYGKIIGISSVVASTGNPGQVNYVASKAGMIGLYKSLAIELARRNINVNIVSPGFITTQMTDKLNENQKNEILNKIPMKKFGKPEDVANLVYFLSSEESSYITGQNFNINGGMLMP